MKRRLASTALATVLGLSSFYAFAIWVLPASIAVVPGTPDPLPLALMGCALLALGRLLSTTTRTEA